MSTYIKLSRGQFSVQDLLSMESTILDTLSWKMNPVTVTCFLNAFMEIYPKPHEIMRDWKYTSKASVYYNHNHIYNHEHSSSYRDKEHLILGYHVLHELARYLVELAVCIPAVNPYFDSSSQHHQYYSGAGNEGEKGHFINEASPSAISYAAIHLAMDMMTLTAVPNYARIIFNERMKSTQESIYNSIQQQINMVVEVVEEEKEQQDLDPVLLLPPTTIGQSKQGTWCTGLVMHPFKD